MYLFALQISVSREISTANMSHLFISLHSGKGSLATTLTDLSFVQRKGIKHYWGMALTKWQPSQLESHNAECPHL